MEFSTTVKGEQLLKVVDRDIACLTKYNEQFIEEHEELEKLKLDIKTKLESLELDLSKNAKPRASEWFKKDIDREIAVKTKLAAEQIQIALGDEFDVTDGLYSSVIKFKGKGLLGEAMLSIKPQKLYVYMSLGETPDCVEINWLINKLKLVQELGVDYFGGKEFHFGERELDIIYEARKFKAVGQPLVKN